MIKITTGSHALDELLGGNFGLLVIHSGMVYCDSLFV